MVCDPSAIRTEIIRVGEGGATDCLFFLTYFVIRSFSFSIRPLRFLGSEGRSFCSCLSSWL